MLQFSFIPGEVLTLGLSGFKKTRFDFFNWCKEQFGSVVLMTTSPEEYSIKCMHNLPACYSL